MSDERSLREAATGSLLDGSTDPAHEREVTPSAGCGCASCQAREAENSGGKKTAESSPWVYALGRIGYDVISTARQDAIREAMGGEGHHPEDPKQLLAYVKSSPWDAASIHWTLSHDRLPIYAIAPTGPYTRESFDFLIDALRQQVEKGSDDQLVVAGRVGGHTKLLDGTVVPVILAERRGMRIWKIADTIARIAGPDAARRRAAEAFFARVIDDLSVRGVTPSQRAINYAVTSSIAIRGMFDEVLKSSEPMELDAIAVERSPYCRPDSDCYDVKLFFFYPGRQVQAVRMVYRFTVDVSDVVPVTVGPMRSWAVR